MTEAQEIQWLLDHPDFAERPASIREFVGPDYLNLEANIRPGIMAALAEVFGPQVNDRTISLKRKAVFSGAIGVGKQNRVTEPVLTPKGWRPIGELKVGDQVIGKNGRATTVTGVYPQHDIQMYRMTFKDGTWIDTGDEHLWEVHESKSVGVKGPDGKWRTKRVLEPRVVTTQWLYDNDLKQGSSYRYRIPLVDPVEFAPQEPGPVDPYTLGQFLANGSLHHGTPRLACHEDDRDELMGLIVAPGTRVAWDQSPGRRGGYIVISSQDRLRRKWSNPLAVAFDRAGLYGVTARDKFIPESYLTDTPENRLALLRGLMDGDGSSYKQINQQIFSTSSPRLAQDVADLVRSLGGYCTVTTFDRREATEHQVHVNLDDVCPFRLSRKVANWRPRTNQRPARSIVKVEKLGREDGVCIKVAAEDSLYVTKDYIVTHNTTYASIALTYMVHWTYCLKDPQKFFGLMPGSRIAFMMMSTSERQAKEVLFGDVKARIEHSPWFQQFCQYDRNIKNQFRFDKDLWIVPGGSEETRFEGYNVLAAIVDEGDSHKQTDRKDYAEEGFNTLYSRIDSRFPDTVNDTHRGLILVIGQMKSATGFMNKIFGEFKDDPHGSSFRLTIWEAFGWHKYTENPKDAETGRETAPRKSFVYDIQRKKVLSRADADEMGIDYSRNDGGYIEVPTTYLTAFRRNPVKALRDLAGIPPQATDPFIALTERIDSCQELWHKHYGDESPVTDSPSNPQFKKWFSAPDKIKRVAHVDIATSGDGDAMGIAIAHIPGLVEVDGEEKPLIVFDALMRIHAPSGSEIMLSDMRRILYRLRDDLGFELKMVTFDGFQSTDSIQLLRKARIATDYLSVDRSKQPYEDLREGIYDERILFPRYLTALNEVDTDLVNIAYQELSQLTDVGPKIDHPPKGCFVGSTRIPTLDGQFPEIAELDGQETWVYSATPEGKIVPGRARGRYTKHTDHLVDVILDNGYVARCTPDHRWMLRDGTYKAAEDLSPGIDRLMPITFNWPVNGGYSRVGDKDGLRTLTHTLILEHELGRKLAADELAHHKDHVKTNNDPSNLELMTFAEHKSHHANEAWERARQRQMKEGHEKWLESPAKDEMYARRSNPGWVAGKTPEQVQAIVEKKSIYRRDITVDSLRSVATAKTANEAARMLGCGRNVVTARLRSAGFSSWAEFVEALDNNHKVRAVIHVKLDEAVPVYDLEVDEWSNFALSGGVFVHNSKDIADAMAGCVSTLMQMPQWRRGAPLLSSGGVSATEVDSDADTMAEVFAAAAKPTSPSERIPSFDEFLQRNGGGPGLHMQGRDEDEERLPFVGGRAGVTPPAFGGIA